jgi:hypothetical protein
MKSLQNDSQKQRRNGTFTELRSKWLLAHSAVLEWRLKRVELGLGRHYLG